jgi:hypothetical protein
MTKISSDIEFRQNLAELDPARQRAVAVRFVENVLALSGDERIEHAVRVAGNPEASTDELAAAFKAIKKIILEKYTRCGADCDWKDQSDYFIARATAACLSPQLGRQERGKIAWQAAVGCRMARTCLSIDAEDSSPTDESDQQYRVLSEFLAT